jgi:DNA-binding NarL/FixJ family response regulator
MMDEFENDALLQRSIPSGLTPRQRDVLLGLIHGQGEKQIARTMNLSIHTVHVYVKGVYDHYQVHTRTELFSKCILRLLRLYSGEKHFSVNRYLESAAVASA